MPRHEPTRNDLGQEPPFLDISAVNTDIFGEADEYNSDRYHGSASSARGPLPSPLSSISCKSFAIRDLGDLPSHNSAVLRGIDVGTQPSFSAGESLLFAVDPSPPSTSTSQAGAWLSSFLSDLQAQGTLGSNPLIFGYFPPGQIADELPPSPLIYPAPPRRKFCSLPPMPPISQLILTSLAHNDELTNEQNDPETTYQSSHSSDDGLYRTARSECPLQQKYQQEKVPEICLPLSTQTINELGYFVVYWEISLRDTHSIISALQHSLENLTIGPAPIINQSFVPSSTEKIDLPHLTSLKVDRGVDYSVLKQLLSFAKMDNLRSLELHVDESQGFMPHELIMEWSQLRDVTLHCDLSPQALHGMRSSLCNVTRLAWSGKLVGSGHIEGPTFELGSLQTASICSDENGCNLFVQLLQNLGKRTLQTLHLSHFSPTLRTKSGRGLAGVTKLSISSGINMNQFWDILSHIPTLENGDFALIDHNVTTKEEHGWTPSKPLAQLTSLTLRKVAAPVLKYLQATFPNARHQILLGLTDSLEQRGASNETSFCQT